MRHPTTRPAISVCVPTLNSARTIGATLDSVFAQDFTDFEVVVVDNDSTDETLDVVASYDDPRLRVVACDDRLPIGRNWTRAVRSTEAELVKLICSDDLVAPRCLSVQVPLMADDRVALVASRFDLIDDDGATIGRNLGLCDATGRMSSTFAARTFVRRLPDELFPSAAATFRRRDFDRTTGFRDDFVYTLDIDLWLQIARFGAFVGCAESLAANRASEFNLSSATSTAQKMNDLLRFKHWAFRNQGPPSGPIRVYDLVIGDSRVVQATLRRAYTRAITRRPAMEHSAA